MIGNRTRFSQIRATWLTLASVLILSFAGPVAAAERVVVEMGNGDRIEGELVRRDAAAVYLLVGGSLVTLDAKKVKRLVTDQKGAVGPDSVKKHKLYATARQPVRDMQTLVEEMGPAVVVVKTPRGLGTGWFCNKDGYLVTNHHVVAGERSIRVTLFPRQGKRLGRKVFRKVRIVALNAEMDLALLKVEEPLTTEIPQLYLGDSTALKVGDKAFAIGNPLGLERSTSEGIVSKVGRNLGGRLFIQTTAPIAPGNSGGPLFNARGEVVGVVSRGAILLDGLGFAIPSGYVKEFLDNVESFAYDEDNPNTGIAYMEAPVSTTDRKIRFTSTDFVRVGHGLCCLQVDDLDRDKVAEVVFADNNKSEIGVLRLRKPGSGDRGAQDAWDINQLPGSRLFELETHPVASRVSSIAVGDLDADGLRDVVFYGDVDGLSVMRAMAGGKFHPVRKIDDVQAAGTEDAIRIADLDSDGKQDVFVLGRERFTIFWKGQHRQEYPLAAALHSKVKHFELTDLDKDRKLDLVLFVNNKHYGTIVRLQSGDKRFDEGQPLRSQISGPVRPFRSRDGLRFLALDSGINRVRQLKMRDRAAATGTGGQNRALFSLAVESGAKAGSPVAQLDVDGDAKWELLTVDRGRSEFVFIEHTRSGFKSVRSPSPRQVATLALHRSSEGRMAAFSFSRSDKILGVSRFDDGRISFPRPVYTEGDVQWMQIERLRGFDGRGKERAYVFWVEKSGGGHVLRTVLADDLLRAASKKKAGSIDVSSTTLRFGPKPDKLQEKLPGKVKRLAFADFNGDDRQDLVVFWAYSENESLYLGLGGGRFQEVSKRLGLIEDESRQAVLVQDLDGDGRRDVLQVHPGFVRTLRIDLQGRLYVHQQINWAHGKIDQLAPYAIHKKKARLVVISGKRASVVQLDKKGTGFETIDRIDLTGVELGRIETGDVDGDRKPDLVGSKGGAIQILLNRPPRRGLVSKIALNASMNHFSYWNLVTVDLDRDGVDEVLMFDNRKAILEILRIDKSFQLQSVFRHPLFTEQLNKHVKPGGKSQGDQPREVGAGDVDGNGKVDLVFALHDRLAIYLQGGR